jgi:hypothetical protein
VSVAAFAQIGPLGFGPLPAVVLPVTVSFLSATGTDSPSATNNFTMSIGSSPSAGRWICAGLWMRGTGSVPFNAVTVNGFSLSSKVDQNGSGDPGNTQRSAIWCGNVPTGSGSVTVTVTSGLPLGVYVGLWQVNNLANGGATTSTAGAASSGATMTLASVITGGVVLCAGGDNDTNAMSWSGVTSDWHTVLTRHGDGASAIFSTAQTNYNVTATFVGPSIPSAACISLR